MQLLRWSSEIELGFEQIDNQHKQLFNMINELSLACTYGQPNSVMLHLVERLQEYATTHFKAEEDLFSSYDYPDRVDHEADHASFFDSINYMRKQCEIIDTPMAGKIRDFLIDWLWNHIKSKDMKYKKFIDKRRLTGL
ncbi:MAG: bacteriohemerythrin [Desulfuromonadaceae bacterium]|nr:bacteriohemerythrin [Desulfuromonadaceae bacterium]